MAPAKSRTLTSLERATAAQRMRKKGDTRGQSVNDFNASVMAGEHDEYISQTPAYIDQQGDHIWRSDVSLEMSLNDPCQGPITRDYLQGQINRTTERQAHAKAVTGRLPLQASVRPVSEAEHTKMLEKRRLEIKEREQMTPDVNAGDAGAIAFVFIPESYPPSTKSLAQLSEMRAHDLRLNTHHRGKFLVVQVLADPAFEMDFLLTVVKDGKGKTERLELHHAQRQLGLEALPNGCFIAIKEPYYAIEQYEDMWVIRVDHPADIVRLTPKSPFLPSSLRDLSLSERMKSLSVQQKTAAQWKEEGNEAIKAGNQVGAERARRCYTEGLDVAEEHEADLMLDLFRNRSFANLQLGRYDQTIVDAMSSMISSDTADGPLTERHQELNHKSMFRAARAYYKLRQWAKARDALTTCMGLKSDFKNKEAHELLRKVSCREAEEQTGKYDFDSIIAGLSRSSRVDVADFLKRTEVKAAPTRGRGLFATEDMDLGDLILVEKAAHALFDNDPGYGMNFMYESATDDVVQMHCSLWRATVRELERNPSRVPELLGLFDRDYAKDPSEGRVVDGQVVLDVFHVKALILYNAQGSATPKASQKTKPFGFSSYDGDQNGGIWPRKSIVNYSCLPNASRSNIGDLLILRANRRIKKGEEILANFGFIGNGDVEYRRRRLMASWGVTCTCNLCIVEAGDSAQNRSRRRELFNKFATSVNRPSIGKANCKKNLADLDKLRRELVKTYDNRYTAVPRPAMISVDFDRYLNHQILGEDDSSLWQATKKVIASYGWKATVDGATVTLMETDRSMVDQRLVPAVIEAAYLQERVGNAAAKTPWLDIAKLLYRTMNGVEHGFINLTGEATGPVTQQGPGARTT